MSGKPGEQKNPNKAKNKQGQTTSSNIPGQVASSSLPDNKGKTGVSLRSGNQGTGRIESKYMQKKASQTTGASTATNTPIEEPILIPAPEGQNFETITTMKYTPRFTEGKDKDLEQEKRSKKTISPFTLRSPVTSPKLTSIREEDNNKGKDPQITSTTSQTVAAISEPQTIEIPDYTPSLTDFAKKWGDPNPTQKKDEPHYTSTIATVTKSASSSPEKPTSTGKTFIETVDSKTFQELAKIEKDTDERIEAILVIEEVLDKIYVKVKADKNNTKASDEYQNQRKKELKLAKDIAAIQWSLEEVRSRAQGGSTITTPEQFAKGTLKEKHGNAELLVLANIIYTIDRWNNWCSQCENNTENITTAIHGFCMNPNNHEIMRSERPIRTRETLASKISGPSNINTTSSQNISGGSKTPAQIKELMTKTLTELDEETPATKPTSAEIIKIVDENVLKIIKIQIEIDKLQEKYKENKTNETKRNFEEARKKQLTLAEAIAKVIKNAYDLMSALQGTAEPTNKTWFDHEKDNAATNVLAAILKDKAITEGTSTLSKKFMDIEAEICSNNTWLTMQIEGSDVSETDGLTILWIKEWKKKNEEEDEEDEEEEKERYWREAKSFTPNQESEPQREVNKIQIWNKTARNLAKQYEEEDTHEKFSKLRDEFMERRKEQVKAAREIVYKINQRTQISSLKRGLEIKLTGQPWIQDTPEDEAIIETLLQLAVPGKIRNQIESREEFIDRWFDITDEDMLEDAIPMTEHQALAWELEAEAIETFRAKWNYQNETDDEEKIKWEKEFKESKEKQWQIATLLAMGVHTLDDISELNPLNKEWGFSRNLDGEQPGVKESLIVAMTTSNWTVKQIHKEMDLIGKVVKWKEDWDNIEKLGLIKNTGGITGETIELKTDSSGSPQKNEETANTEGTFTKLRRASASALEQMKTPLRRLSDTIGGINWPDNKNIEGNHATLTNKEKVQEVAKLVRRIQTLQEDISLKQRLYGKSGNIEFIIKRDFKQFREEQMSLAEEIAELTTGPIHLANIIATEEWGEQGLRETWKAQRQSLAATEVLVCILVDQSIELGNSEEAAQMFKQIDCTTGWGNSWLQSEVEKIKEERNQTEIGEKEKAEIITLRAKRIWEIQSNIAKVRKIMWGKIPGVKERFLEMREQQIGNAEVIAKCVMSREQLAQTLFSGVFNEKDNLVVWEKISGKWAKSEVLESMLMNWQIREYQSKLEEKLIDINNKEEWEESWVKRRIQELKEEQDYSNEDNQQRVKTPENQIQNNNPYYTFGGNMDNTTTINTTQIIEQTENNQTRDTNWFEKYQERARQTLARRNQGPTYTFPTTTSINPPPKLLSGNQFINLEEEDDDDDELDWNYIPGPLPWTQSTNIIEPNEEQNIPPNTTLTNPNYNRKPQTETPVIQKTNTQPKPPPRMETSKPQTIRKPNLVPRPVLRTFTDNNRRENNNSNNQRQQTLNNTLTVLLGQDQQQDQQQQQNPHTNTNNNNQNRSNNNNNNNNRRNNNNGGGGNNRRRLDTHDQLLNEDGTADGFPFYSYNQLKELLKIMQPQTRQERTVAPLPKFSDKENEDPWEWWNNYNEIAGINNMSEERKLELVTLSLGGRAKLWYTNERDNITEWEANPDYVLDNSFKTAFERRFCNREVQQTFMEQLQNKMQGPNQDVEEYAFQVQELASKADPTNEYPDHMLLEIFIRGLRTNIQMQVRLLGTTNTFEEAVKAAKRIEKSFKMTKGNFVANYNAETQQILAAELAEIKKELRKATVQPNNRISCSLCYATNPDHSLENCPNRSMNRNYNYGRSCTRCRSKEHSTQQCPQTGTATRCYNCNGTGHMARDCRQKPICRACNRSGHTAKDCGITSPIRTLNSANRTFSPYTSEQKKCEKCGNPGHTKERCNAKSCDYCKQLGHVEDDCWAMKKKFASWQTNILKKGLNNKTYIATEENQEQPIEMEEQINSAVNKSVAEMLKNLHLKD
jgi:cellular nucleic acid-binding protein